MAYTVAFATVVQAGTIGFRVGDVLIASGGTASVVATFTVATVNGAGQIQTVSVQNAGSYTVPAGNPDIVTGGTGSGTVTLNLSWTGVAVAPHQRIPRWVLRRPAWRPAIAAHQRRTHQGSKFPGTFFAQLSHRIPQPHVLFRVPTATRIFYKQQKHRQLFRLPVAQPKTRRPHWPFRMGRRLPAQKQRHLYRFRGTVQLPRTRRPRWNFRLRDAGLSLWRQGPRRLRRFSTVPPQHGKPWRRPTRWLFRLPIAKRIFTRGQHPKWVQPPVSSTYLLIVNPNGPGVGSEGLPQDFDNVTLVATGINNALSPIVTITPMVPITITPQTLLGAIVATVTVTYNSSTPFYGVVTFGAPNFDDGGTYALVPLNGQGQNPLRKNRGWKFSANRWLPRLKSRRLFNQIGATPRAARTVHRWRTRPTNVYWTRNRKPRRSFLTTVTVKRSWGRHERWARAKWFPRGLQRKPRRIWQSTFNAAALGQHKIRWTRAKWFPRQQYRKLRRLNFAVPLLKSAKRWTRKRWFQTVRANRRPPYPIYRQVPRGRKPVWRFRAVKPAQRVQSRRLATGRVFVPYPKIWRKPPHWRFTQFRRMPVQKLRRLFTQMRGPAVPRRKPVPWRFVQWRKLPKQARNKFKFLVIPVPAAKRPHWRFVQARKLPTQKPRRSFSQRGATPVPCRIVHRWLSRPKTTWRPVRKRRATPLFTLSSSPRSRRCVPTWVRFKPRIARVVRRRFAKISFPQRFIAHRPQRWIIRSNHSWRAKRKFAYPIYRQVPTNPKAGPKRWRRKVWSPPARCSGPKRLSIAPIFISPPGPPSFGPPASVGWGRILPPIRNY